MVPARLIRIATPRFHSTAQGRSRDPPDGDPPDGDPPDWDPPDWDPLSRDPTLRCLGSRDSIALGPTGPSKMYIPREARLLRLLRSQLRRSQIPHAPGATPYNLSMLRSMPQHNAAQRSTPQHNAAGSLPPSRPGTHASVTAAHASAAAATAAPSSSSTLGGSSHSVSCPNASSARRQFR